MNKLSPQRARERALFQYRNALDRGDFGTVMAVLKLAERDSVLTQMIEEMAELDDAPIPRPEWRITSLFRRSKGITEVVVRRDPSPNGWTPIPDQSEEEMDMFTTFVPARSPHYTGARKLKWDPITLAAAVLVVVVLGIVLLFMRAPFNPGAGGQFEETIPEFAAQPQPCIAAGQDPQAESARLAGEANALLEPRALLNTPVEDRPAIIEQAGLLALCALQTAYTPEADAVLQQVMGITGIGRSFQGNGDGGGAFSPDGHSLLMGDGNTLRLRDVATGEEIREFVGHTGYILKIAFSPDGRYILSGSIEDETSRMWDVETGEEIHQFLGVAFAFSPDGRYALSVDGDGIAHLWDAATGEEIRQFVGHRNVIFGAAFSPDGRYVATSSWDTTVRLWDAATGDELRQFQPFREFAGMVAFSSDGKYLLNSGTYAVRLSDVETGETLREYTRQGSRVLGFPSFSPDDRYVLASDRDNRLALLWDAETGELVRIFDGRRFDPDAGRMFNVNFSPDGQSIVMGTANASGGSPYDRVWLWDTDYHDTIARACEHVTRDFTAEERTQYGLGVGTVCP